ncbi:MAG TPA: hypothetical protein VNT22_01985 [Baekduia sp.]|nr:hypothetical protein [Baekduia sp.]
MPKKFLGLLVGALLTIVPASAGAAVSIRAEAGSPDAVLSASVTPTKGPVSGDGGAFSCSGTNTAAGALNAATGGDWSGQKFSGIDDIQVGRITSADFTTASSAPYYWSFNVNELPASAGICGTPVGDGDRVLFYKACNMATTGCYSGTILSLTAPATIAPGAATFVVEQVATTYPAPDFIPTTTRAPAAGVTVTAAGSTAVTGGDGKVTLSLPASAATTVRATRANDVPAQTQVCVNTGNDGLCGTVDKRIPTATFSIAKGQRFKKKGPRTLKGTATDSSGIKSVQLRLTERPSTRSGDCTTFDATKAKFVAQKTCGAKKGKLFPITTAGGNWSYLLPKAPGRGRYVLDALVTDNTGNKHLARVIFFVR